MIEEACLAIERLSEQERKDRVHRGSRRRKMRYIDGLLNELEMLNMAERADLPSPLGGAVGKLLEGLPARSGAALPRLETVVAAMDALYEVQDSLMLTDHEGE